MILLINSEVANIGSWSRILKQNNHNFIISDSLEEKDLSNIKKIIFPGVGNFGKVMKNIITKKIDKLIINLINNYNAKYLGVCVGMQILFKKSEEDDSEGLGLIEGNVKKNNFKEIPITHNGWNNNIFERNHPLIKNIDNLEDFYFNHSYYCEVKNTENTIAYLDQCKQIATIVGNENILGVQFHPEKSHDSGLQIIQNFIEL